MSEGHAPECLAMVLCDAVYREPSTGKFTLLGTFSRLSASAIPIKAQFCVYFAITDCIGKTTVGLRVVDSRSLISDDFTGEPLADVEAEIASEDPLAIVEGVLGARIQLPEAGVYYCELYSGSNVLAQRRLIASAP